MNRIARTIVAASCLLSASTLMAQTKQVDWAATAHESQTILGDYLRVNTTNPPGNELLAARFLKQILDREGIEAQILDTIELGPNRANLYARLRGNGAKRAIALVHHMDVVPATPASWSIDPFSGTIKHG
jgi:acetylornithine deacetylase/succinyl-diaminopimelate desuccinylase-like protein